MSCSVVRILGIIFAVAYNIALTERIITEGIVDLCFVEFFINCRITKGKSIAGNSR